MKPWNLKYKGIPNIYGHMFYNFTKGKIYEAKCVRMTGKVINHWIVDDTGKKILLSANARREQFDTLQAKQE